MTPVDLDDTEGDPLECEPRWIDGQYYGCGVCRPCEDREDDRAQVAYEMGETA